MRYIIRPFTYLLTYLLSNTYYANCHEITIKARTILSCQTMKYGAVLASAAEEADDMCKAWTGI